MKTIFPAALLLAALTGCNGPERRDAPTEANFRHALQEYLARRGDLCVGRSTWPVDVTRAEFAQGSRNALQLPVLEKLGLVASTVVEVADAGDAQPRRRTEARRYQLTETGNHYYLARPPRLHPESTHAADHDLCTARLTLHEVVRWDLPGALRPGAQTTVTYTYDIAPAPWTADADARRVFPVIDRMVRGAGTLQLREPMVLTQHGWQAEDL